ncbi:MAG: hypothetical protein HQL25_06935 [Candidatus Omnitrophica bacterium]|nr:hypothetical protein [Candidatus Omnitrophota bacterium]
MKKVIMSVFISLTVVGCVQIKDGGDDYLKADQWRKGDMHEAYVTLRDDYLKSEIGDKQAQKEAEVAASEHAKASEFSSEFDVLKPFTDQDSGMPETYDYYFINFPPLVITDENRDSSLLVVVSRGEGKIEYMGVFVKPQGDLFYRYRDVLKGIK